MRYPLTGAVPRLVTAVLFASVTSCTLESPRGMGTTLGPGSVFSDAQIASTNATNAWDVIALLHPAALNIGGASVRNRTVYLDGSRLGGVEALRWIPAQRLAEIRFLSATEAAMLFAGGKASGGAIILRTKVGP